MSAEASNEDIAKYHNATGLALVEMRLGQLEINIDTLTKKFDVAMNKFPTVDTINLIMQPIQVQINSIVGIQRDIEGEMKELEVEFRKDLKDLEGKVRPLEVLSNEVAYLKDKEKTRSNQSWQIKLSLGLAIFTAIVTPLITLIITGKA